MARVGDWGKAWMEIGCAYMYVCAVCARGITVCDYVAMRVPSRQQVRDLSAFSA